MKKKIFIASLVVVGLVTLSGGIVLANRSTPPIKPVSNTVTKTASTPPVQQTTTPVVQEQTVTPADTPVVTPPTPDENKAAIMKKISDYATSIGLTDNNGMVFAQTNCFDHAISSSIGYSSYDNLLDSAKLPILAQYLGGSVVFDGPVTCRVIPQVVR